LKVNADGGCYYIGYWKDGLFNGYGRKIEFGETEEGLFDGNLFRPNHKQIISYDPKTYKYANKIDLDKYITIDDDIE